jgi:hypothetical protein
LVQIGGHLGQQEWADFAMGYQSRSQMDPGWRRHQVPGSTSRLPPPSRGEFW